MTGFVKTIGDTFVEYPYGAAELQRDNPQAGYPYECDFVSIFPSTPSAIENGYKLFPVTIDDVPPYSSNQSVQRSDQPFLRDGKWVFSWIVKDLTEEQIAARNLRNKFYE